LGEPFNDDVLALLASGGGGIERLAPRYAHMPLTPFIDNPPRTRPSPADGAPLSIMTLELPSVQTPSSPAPPPPSSILLDNFPDPHPFDGGHSNPGPVDPFDTSIWRPESLLSVPLRARDGEFQRFILDETGRMGNPGLTSYAALFMRLKHDANRVKSCCIVWERVSSINIRTRYFSGPLSDFISFRNNVAILRSNGNYSRQDVASTLGGISHLNATPESDTSIIRACGTGVALITTYMLEMEAYIACLDAIITHSSDEYLLARESGTAQDDFVPVIPLDNEDDQAEDGVIAEAGQSDNEGAGEEAASDNDSVIDLCD
jgi:hypothetical protein